MDELAPEASRATLSPRERAIALAAAHGLSDKEIALELGVRISTVRTYWERMRRKLHAINRTHAVCLALDVPGVSPDGVGHQAGRSHHQSEKLRR